MKLLDRAQASKLWPGSKRYTNSYQTKTTSDGIELSGLFGNGYLGFQVSMSRSFGGSNRAGFRVDTVAPNSIVADLGVRPRDLLIQIGSLKCSKLASYDAVTRALADQPRPVQLVFFREHVLRRRKPKRIPKPPPRPDLRKLGIVTAPSANTTTTVELQQVKSAGNNHVKLSNTPEEKNCMESSGHALLARRGRQQLNIEVNKPKKVTHAKQNQNNTEDVVNVTQTQFSNSSTKHHDSPSTKQQQNLRMKISATSKPVRDWPWLTNAIENEQPVRNLSVRSLPECFEWMGDVSGSPFMWLGDSSSMVCFPHLIQSNILEVIPKLDSLHAAASYLLPNIHHAHCIPWSSSDAHIYLLSYIAFARVALCCVDDSCAKLSCLRKQRSMTHRRWGNQMINVLGPYSTCSVSPNTSRMKSMLVDQTVTCLFRICESFTARLQSTPRSDVLIKARGAVPRMFDALVPFLSFNTFGLDANPKSPQSGVSSTVQFQCGRLFKFHLNDNGSLCSATCLPYLLDNSMVNETRSMGLVRSFDIYYQLCAARPKLAGKLHHQTILRDRTGGKIGSKYTNMSRETFSNTTDLLSLAGISENEQEELWSLLGTVVLLGNLEFTIVEESTNAAGISRSSKASQKSYKRLCELLGTSCDELENLLCVRQLEVVCGGVLESNVDSPEVRLELQSAVRLRNALMRDLHQIAVSWVVERVNEEASYILSKGLRDLKHETVVLASQTLKLKKCGGVISVFDAPMAGQVAFTQENSLWELGANYAAETLHSVWYDQFMQCSQIDLPRGATEASLLDSLSVLGSFEENDSTFCDDLFTQGPHGLVAAIDEESLFGSQWKSKSGSNWLQRFENRLKQSRESSSAKSDPPSWFKITSGSKRVFEIRHSDGDIIQYNAKEMANYNAPGVSNAFKCRFRELAQVSSIIKKEWEGVVPMKRADGSSRVKSTTTKLWKSQVRDLAKLTESSFVYRVSVTDSQVKVNDWLEQGASDHYRAVQKMLETGALPVVVDQSIATNVLCGSSGRTDTWVAAVVNHLPAEHYCIMGNQVLLSKLAWGVVTKGNKLRTSRSASLLQFHIRLYLKSVRSRRLAQLKSSKEARAYQVAATSIQRALRATILQGLPERIAAKKLTRWSRHLQARWRWRKHLESFSKFQAVVRRYLQRMEYEVIVESACQIQAVARMNRISKRMLHVIHGRWVVNSLARDHGVQSILHPEEIVVFVAFVVVDIVVRVPSIPLHGLDAEVVERTERCRTIWILVSGLGAQRLIVLDTLAGKLQDEQQQSDEDASSSITSPKLTSIPLTCIYLSSGEVHLRCTGKLSFMIRFLNKKREQVVWNCTQMVGGSKVWEKVAQTRIPSIEKLLSAPSALPLFFCTSFKFGTLLKQSPRLVVLPTLWQERWCLLYSGTLFWFKGNASKPAGRLDLNQHTNAWTERDPSIGCGPKANRIGTCFTVSIGSRSSGSDGPLHRLGQSSTVTFQAESEEVCMSWVRAIRRTVSELCDAQVQGGKELIEQLGPPVVRPSKSRQFEATFARWHTASIATRLNQSNCAPWVVCTLQEQIAASVIQRLVRRRLRSYGEPKKNRSSRKKQRSSLHQVVHVGRKRPNKEPSQKQQDYGDSRNARRARLFQHQKARDLARAQITEPMGTTDKRMTRHGFRALNQPHGSPGLEEGEWYTDGSDDGTDEEDDVLDLHEKLPTTDAPSLMSPESSEWVTRIASAPPLAPRSPAVEKERLRIMRVKAALTRSPRNRSQDHSLHSRSLQGARKLDFSHIDMHQTENHDGSDNSIGRRHYIPADSITKVRRTERHLKYDNGTNRSADDVEQLQPAKPSSRDDTSSKDPGRHSSKLRKHHHKHKTSRHKEHRSHRKRHTKASLKIDPEQRLDFDLV